MQIISPLNDVFSARSEKCSDAEIDSQRPPRSILKICYRPSGPVNQTEKALSQNATNQNRENRSLEMAKNQAGPQRTPESSTHQVPRQSSKTSSKQQHTAASQGSVDAASSSKGISKSQPMHDPNRRADHGKKLEGGGRDLESSCSHPIEAMDIDRANPGTSAGGNASSEGTSVDPLDALNQIPGVQVFRPGEFDNLNLTPQEREVRNLD